MPVRLDWRLGAGDSQTDAPPPAFDPEPPVEVVIPDGNGGGGQSSHRGSGVSGTVAKLLVTLLLLIVAGVGGFFIGQWSEARTFVVHGVENQLALEQLAWREGDRELYQSTLDDWSTVEWRSAQVFEFVTHAPRHWDARLVDLLPIEEGRRLQATVEISTPGNAGEIVIRFYELRGERWLRAEP